jgi:uncharacterized protein YndB with AHSA1/START domain
MPNFIKSISTIWRGSPMSEPGILIDANTVRFKRLVPGPVERVWQYLTESEKRRTWFAAGELEPRVGGSLELRFDNSNVTDDQTPPPERFSKYAGVHISQHTITRFEPPRLLAFTWSSGIDGGPSEVLIELTPKGGQVELVLTHSRISGREPAINFSTGWHTHLDVLVDRLNERAPIPFWDVFAKLEGIYEKRYAK